MSDVESRTVVEEQLQDNAEPDVTETVIEPKKKTRKPKTAKQMEAFEKMVAAKKAKQAAKPAKSKKVVMNIVDAPSGSESEEEVVVKRNKRKPSKKRRKKGDAGDDRDGTEEVSGAADGTAESSAAGKNAGKNEENVCSKAAKSVGNTGICPYIA